MSDDNRKSDIKAQAFFENAYREAEEKFGKRAASLGWLRYFKAAIGNWQGSHRKFMQETLPAWDREPVSEQSEGVDLELGRTVRTVVHNAAKSCLFLAGNLFNLELEEYRIQASFSGLFSDEAIEQGARAYSRAIGTIDHTGYDDDDNLYTTLLQMSEEDQLREQESLPLNAWMGFDNGAPDEEAARRHGYYVQYSRKGFRYVDSPDDGSVPPTWVNGED